MSRVKNANFRDSEEFKSQLRDFGPPPAVMNVDTARFSPDLTSRSAVPSRKRNSEMDDAASDSTELYSASGEDSEDGFEAVRSRKAKRRSLRTPSPASTSTVQNMSRPRAPAILFMPVVSSDNLRHLNRLSGYEAFTSATCDKISKVLVYVRKELTYVAQAVPPHDDNHGSRRRAGRAGGRAGRTGGPDGRAGRAGRTGGPDGRAGRAGRTGGPDGRAGRAGRTGGPDGRAGRAGRTGGPDGRAGRAGRTGGPDGRAGRAGRAGRTGGPDGRAGRAGRTGGPDGRAGRAGRTGGPDGRAGRAGRTGGPDGRK
ncbi:translation initiation factor IF-2-like [Dermacentor silvarum]|uniref:translation initiation factor IF-2-like n=1 Tax=Dermacentor silvarum TaxID=543639 RepID=UPI00189A22C5|nr:translation initiation factor IF-2-like [Dermacentor silvarum]